MKFVHIVTLRVIQCNHIVMIYLTAEVVEDTKKCGVPGAITRFEPVPTVSKVHKKGSCDLVFFLFLHRISTRS